MRSHSAAINQGGEGLETAWLRLEEYFNRFHLSIHIQCQLEISALPLTVGKDRILVAPPLSHKGALPLANANPLRRLKDPGISDDCLLLMKDGAQRYTGRQIELNNLAYCRQPIRNAIASELDMPYLEMTLVVLPLDGGEGETCAPSSGFENGAHHDAREPESVLSGNISLVRLVNGIPLLDNSEFLACGLLNTIASCQRVWMSFGLKVSLSSSSKMEARTPSLAVRDSEQVIPFLKQGNHMQFEANEPFDDASEHSSDSPSIAGERRNQRRRPRIDCSRRILPAHIRLARTLLVVHVSGSSDSLPLPTLSKASVSHPSDSVCGSRRIVTDYLFVVRSSRVVSHVITMP